MLRKVLFGAVAISILFLVPMMTMAQSTFGSITGTVTDPSGAIVPSAQIQVTNEGTGGVRKVATTGAGVFNVPNLDIGTYKIQVTAKGFTTYERGELHLSANQILNLDVKLRVGSTSTVVQVQGASPVIDTQSTGISGSMPHQSIQALPLVSRHTGDGGIYAYVDYNTGVATVPHNSLNVIGGARLETGTLPTMDGIAVTAYWEGASPVQPSLEGVQEVKVQTAVAPAEFATAGNIQVVTRSGTNQFHGGAFWDYNGNALNARNFFSKTVPFRVFHNFAADAGGPIKKNKLFFFADYEGAREAATRTLVESVPLPEWRTGDFSNLLPGRQLVDPLTGQAYNGNIIPPGSISTVSNNIQSYGYPMPNSGAPGTVANNWTANFPGNTGFTHFDNVDGRVDYNIDNRDTLFVRISYRRMPLTVAGIPYPLRRNQVRYGKSAVLSWTHTLTSAAVNEFRFGATYHRNHYMADVIGSDLLNQFGITGVPTIGVGTAPYFNISGVTPWNPGSNSDNYEDNPITTFEWLDNLSWTRGRHFMKFGFDVIHDRLNGNNIHSDVYGNYNFSGVYTGFGYADFLLGIPQTTTLALVNPNYDYRGTTWGMYAQDQFRVSTRLTLNYGLRWELTGPYSSKTGSMYNFDPATGSVVVPDSGANHLNPLYPSNIPVVTATQAGFPADSLLNLNKYNFQPRIGFAYRLFSGSKAVVVRGGYGIYTNLIYAPMTRSMSGGPFSGSVTYINSITNGVPLLSFPSPFLTSGTASTQNVNGENPNLKDPYTQQWQLSLEHQIGHIGLRISYKGAHSVQLVYRRNLNQPAPSTTPFSTSLRPYPLYSQIIYSDSGGNDSYNALEVSAHKRYGQNLTFNTGWTWQKDLTDTLDAGGGGGTFGGQVIQDQFNRAAEKSNSGYTVPQRFYAYALYTLPFGRGQHFLSKATGPVQQVLGGWRTTYTMIAQSGNWFTPSFSGFDPSNTSSFGGRPDRIGNGNLSSGQRGIDGWFNPAAFKIPGCPDNDPVCSSPANVGRFGNAGLDVLSSPPLWDFDFGLQKDFKIRENVTLTFSTTMANAFNHPNFSTPASNISSVNTVGTISSTTRVDLGEPAYREIDFSLRLAF